MHRYPPFPRYPDDADYTTNATSFQDYLARWNLLMKKLAKRVWEFDKQMADRLAEWDARIDGLDAVVIAKMTEWMQDGTLAEIINEVIFGELNDKITTVEGKVAALESWKTVIDAFKTATETRLDTVEDSIEGALYDLSLVNGLTDEKVYLYVNNAYTGDDSDGSNAKPFKTIQACFDSIPKVINHDRFIMIAPGTYPEDARIKSVSGAAIYPQSNVPGQYYQVNSMEFFDINGLVRVENAHFLGQGEDLNFNVRYSRCNYATTNNCKFFEPNIGTEKVAIEYDGTIGSVNSTVFADQYTCIFAQNGSQVRVDSTNEVIQGTPLRAVSIFSAHVYFNGDVDWIDDCTNPITVSRGGRYTWDRSYKVLTPLNGWSHQDNDTYQARAFKDDSNMIQLMGGIKGGTVGQVNALVLPEGYRPVFNNYVFGCYADDGSICKVVVDRTGQLQVQTGSNLPYVSLANIRFYAGR